MVRWHLVIGILLRYEHYFSEELEAGGHPTSHVNLLCSEVHAVMGKCNSELGKHGWYLTTDLPTQGLDIGFTV